MQIALAAPEAAEGGGSRAGKVSAARVPPFYYAACCCFLGAILQLHGQGTQPQASNASYNYTANGSLSVPVPGVLANDTDPQGLGLIAQWVSGPTYGTLTLSSSGAFVYTPATNFSGTDTFVYQASDGMSTSAPATVTLVGPPFGSLFYDNFARASDPGPLDPWIAQSNLWTVTGGTLQGGPNPSASYGYVYITNVWGDYAVEAQLQFSDGGYGGGLGARLDPLTGTHYAAWIYPSGTNVNLVSFQDWATPVFLATADLPELDTNWHTLKLACASGQIAVYFDGALTLNMTDPSPQPFLDGSVSVEMYTDYAPYTMSVSNLLVEPLAVSENDAALENTALLVPSPGVLSNDTGVYGTNLTATLVSGPANGVLNLNSNGGFSYSPSPNFVGTDSFVYEAFDDQTNLGSATMFITVYNTNQAPVLPVQPNRTTAPLITLVVTNTASAPSPPAENFTYTLLSGPTNASINFQGLITWTPTIAQSGVSNVFSTVVTDNDPWALNAQQLSATNSFTVNVQYAPNILISGTALIAESCLPTNDAIDPGETVTMLITLTNAGTGSTAQLVGTLLQDGGVVSPSGPQSYGAVAPGGPSISEPFTFTAAGTCGGTFVASIQLQDGAANLGVVRTTLPLGLTATPLAQNFDSVTPPALPAGWTSTVTNFQTVGQLQVPWATIGSNADTPPNAAHVPEPTSPAFSDLVSPAVLLPAGNLQLSFRSSYNIEIESATAAYDGAVLDISIGSNAFTDILAAGGSFVTGGYNNTIITTSGNRLGGRQAWSGNSQGYVTTLVNLPLSAAGQVVQFRWRLSTDVNNSYSVTGWFVDSISVAGLNCCMTGGPILPAQNDVTLIPYASLLVTNAATDPQNPLASFSYTLLNPPASASINTNGVIAWTPGQGQGGGPFLFTTIATENGNPLLKATNSFYVTVEQILLPPYPTNPVPVAVLTHHSNPARTGANLEETQLNVFNVNTNQFGLLFTRAVDDQVYAQPLLMTNVAVPGRGTHNLVIVATVNDSVYAFDADDPTVIAPYWHASFLGTNVVPPNYVDVGNCSTFSGNLGIIGTPVVDPVSGTIYLVARTKEYHTNFVQRLHALDITTGAERSNSPVIIAATYPGTNGMDDVNGVITFNPLTQNQRPGLALVNGIVYIGWASQCDIEPYHGWLIGYDATTLEQSVVYMTTPNGQEGGIWMSGQAPSVDANGNLYVVLGNGPTDNSISPQLPGNRVESILKLTPTNSTLNVDTSFTPYNWASLDSQDEDLGSSGLLLIPGTNLGFCGSKQGLGYLVNRDNMGGLSSGSTNTNVVQSFQITATTGSDCIRGGPVWWDGPDGSYAYVQGESDYAKQYQFDWTKGLFDLPFYAESPTAAPSGGSPGGFLAISAYATNAGTGILWASHQYSGDAETSTRPGILHAYDAQNISHELWNSQQLSARDGVGNFAKYCPPIVANGKIYLATFSNRLNVYGLAQAPVLNLAASRNSVRLSWITNALWNFTLQCSTNLAAGNWFAVTNTPIPSNGWFQVTFPPPVNAAFYRLKH